MTAKRACRKPATPGLEMPTYTVTLTHDHIQLLAAAAYRYGTGCEREAMLAKNPGMRGLYARWARLAHEALATIECAIEPNRVDEHAKSNR
jgi:hypothetical protein